MSIPAEPSLLQNKVQILIAKPRKKLTGPGGDNVLRLDSVIALSFHCRRWKFGFVNGQVSLAWSIALRTQELYTQSRVLKEMAGREKW